MGKGKTLFLGVLLLVLGCTNTSHEKIESEQIVELNFENTDETNTGRTKNIDIPTIVKIFANDLDYNKYERESTRQEYYNLTDFQGYYSEIVTPIVDCLTGFASGGLTCKLNAKCF